jgi:hypothetical protein
MKLRVCCLLFALMLSPFTSFGQVPSSRLAATSAYTNVPKLVKFSGTATDEAGKPIIGLVGVTFSLYEDEQGGAPLWVETQDVQSDANGHYTAMLGASTSTGVPLEIFSLAEAHWVGAQVSGQREQQRVQLLSVPYALKAADAQTLGGLPASAFMPANSAAKSGMANASPTTPANGLPPAGVTGKGTKDFVPLWTSGTVLGNSRIFETGGNLGVGTKTPKANLDLVGTGKIGIQATVPGTQAAIWGIATATSGGTTGVAGTSSDPKGNGVFGVNNAKKGGVGVIGSSAATSGQTSGVLGVAASTSGVGVSGFETATTGQVFGVTGGTNSTTDFSVGVAGIEGATTGSVFGVSGTAFSTTDGATGVSGFEGASTGGVIGVGGSTSSTSGTGVFGNATATSGPTIGVRGVATSPAGAAGVFLNLSGGASQVLVGQGANFAQVFTVDASGNGFYAGNLNVTGKLTKGSGSFKIDHPLDPANKYLSHSFVESPDMMNVYNGNVTTDRHGLATVVLPDYFEALNGDFRYQLTVMGKFAQAIVAKKIANNRFVIRTNKPEVEVSWQVTGIRHDAYANAYRIPTEEDKPAAELGYYLHPEVFGQPASKNIQADSQRVSSTDQLAKMSHP